MDTPAAGVSIDGAYSGATQWEFSQAQREEHDMQAYKDYRPTGFDAAGAFLPDRQDWLVADIVRTRDTEDAITKANFDSILERLGGESETVEIHRFGHWGPGWYEIILAHPRHESTLYDIEAALENYPILDENKLAEIELEAESVAWELSGRREFWHGLCDKYGNCGCHRIKDWMLYDVEGTPQQDAAEGIALSWCKKHSGAWCEHTSEGPRFDFHQITRLPRKVLIEALRAMRAPETA